jgi:hypothetical protein
VEASSCCTAKSTASAATEAAHCTACNAAPTVGCPSVVAATVGHASAAIIARSEAAAPAPVSAIPRPGTDEHSTGKVARSIIAVGCTRVRCISVVAVRAYRRSGNVSRPESHTHANPDLRL